MEKEFVDEEYWEVVKKKDLVRPQPSASQSKTKPVEKSQATLG